MSTFLRNAAAAVNGSPAVKSEVKLEARGEGTAPAVVDFPLDAIADDATAQVRVLPSDKIAEYAAAMGEPELLADFPPVHLFEDPDSGIVRISQGFTRIAAAKLAGLATFRAVLHRGDARAAFVHALGSNARHGDPRTGADLLHELDKVLRDPELARWSDREIARRVHCSHRTVGDRRRFWIEQGEVQDDGVRLRTDKHGNVTAISVANITAANTARAAAARVMDQQQTYSCIQRGLSRQEPGVQARYDWLRSHDRASDYAFVVPAGWVMDETTFAGQWQRAHDELFARLPRPKSQPASQPAPQPMSQPGTQPGTQPGAQPNFVSAAAPRVAWNKRAHDALGNLHVYLGATLEDLPTVARYLDGFDSSGYRIATQQLLAKVSDLLRGMEADGAPQEEGGEDDNDNDDG